MLALIIGFKCGLWTAIFNANLPAIDCVNAPDFISKNIKKKLLILYFKEAWDMYIVRIFKNRSIHSYCTIRWVNSKANTQRREKNTGITLHYYRSQESRPIIMHSRKRFLVDLVLWNCWINNTWTDEIIRFILSFFIKKVGIFFLFFFNIFWVFFPTTEGKRVGFFRDLIDNNL